MRFGGFGFNRQFGFNAATQAGAAAAAPSIASWPALIGAEMMVNGDCGSATGWTGIVIAGGKGSLTAISDIVENAGLELTVLPGATYRCDFTIDTVSLGSIRWRIGDTFGASRSTAATFSEDIVAGAGDGGWLSATSATMQLDNFSVKSVGLMGVEADWAFTGSTLWFSAPYNSPGFNGAAEGDKAELTGAAKTAFDAAVSNSTACSVTITNDVTDNPVSGTFTVIFKGGSPVSFVFTGVPGEQVAHTVTSGTGSGCIFTAGNDAPAGSMSRIQIS